jgi:hypothetical protein
MLSPYLLQQRQVPITYFHKHWRLPTLDSMNTALERSKNAGTGETIQALVLPAEFDIILDDHTILDPIIRPSGHPTRVPSNFEANIGGTLDVLQHLGGSQSSHGSQEGSVGPVRSRNRASGRRRGGRASNSGMGGVGGMTMEVRPSFTRSSLTWACLMMI